MRPALLLLRWKIKAKYMLERFKSDLRDIGVWRTIFGWRTLARWDVQGIIVPGVFLAVAITALGVDWFPHSLLISQISFVIMGGLLILKIVVHAIEESGSVLSRVLFAVLMSVITTYVFAWVIVQIQDHKNKIETKGFTLDFRTQFVNMSRKSNGDDFYFGFLSPWGLGEQLSAVALLETVRIHNLYPRPITINSYSTAILTRSCGWTYLSDLDPRAGRLLFMHPAQAPPNDNVIVLNANNSLEAKLSNPISAHGQEEGMLIFATKVDCPLTVGETIRLRMDIKDSENGNFSYESSDLKILENTGPPGNTITSASNFEMACTCVMLNTSRAVRRNYTDSVPTYMDMDALKESKSFVIRTISRFTLVWPDGTYSGVR